MFDEIEEDEREIRRLQRGELFRRPKPKLPEQQGDVMERRFEYQELGGKHGIFEGNLLVAVVGECFARPESAGDVAREMARVWNQHDTLVEQRDLLVKALQDVRAKFFEHAQAGANIVKGNLVPLDNEQHPWIPGVEAPRAIEIIDHALATVEQGGGESGRE